MDRKRLRATFDEAAELYDRARPSYPGELIERRAGLLECIARLIDGRYGGWITKKYLFQLEVARR